MVNEDSRIYITVVGAAKLPAADIGGTSDPYVIIKDVTGIHIHGKHVKTSVKKKTLSPTWNEHFEFTCNYKLRHLVFEVYDHDTFSKDDLLGKTKCTIDFLLNGLEQEVTLPLHNKHKHGLAGELYLKLRMAFAYPIVLPGANLVIQERNLQLGLGWDTKKNETIDLDASVIALDGNKQLIDQVSFAHHNAFGSALSHQGDNRTGEGKGDDEVIFMDLAKLNATDPRVEWLLFTINVFSGKTFAHVKSAYIRLLGKDTHRTMAFSRLSKMEQKTGLFFGLLRKDPASGWWTFYSVQRGVEGRKWDQSLPEIVKII